MEPIRARWGLGKPTACLTSYGESNYLGSLPEYTLFFKARSMHSPMPLPQYSHNYRVYNNVV